jgi:putative transposase
MQITYQFRLYPTREQEQRMFRTLTLCRQLYNTALEQREIAYKQQGKSIFYTRQQGELPVLKKELPEYKEVHSQVLQDCLQRLDHAFERFFQKEAGYPRYKSRDHYTSFTYTQPKAVKKTFAQEKQVYLSKIGLVKMKVHRAFDPLKVTQINVKYQTGQWFANISVEIPVIEPIVSTEKGIGMDVGLRTFAALSDETLIENPRYLRKAEKRLAAYQRRLSRKQKGSKNRQKAKRKVAKKHRHVARQRKDFLHKHSYHLVQGHDLIAVEALQVKNMVKNNRLAKSISDAGWSRFVTLIEYKAKKQGKRLVKVPAHGTSQTCVCGATVSKDLSIRLHVCSSCGLTMNRDIVSAKVILQRALSKGA